MTTQPDIVGIWQVTVDTLAAHEPANPIPATVIVDSAFPFELSVAVSGAGLMWSFIDGLFIPFTVHYYAERFGGQPGEVDLGPVTVTMDGSGGPYDYASAASTKLVVGAGALVPGVYRIMCMARWGPGITAFPDPGNELLIEVY